MAVATLYFFSLFFLEALKIYKYWVVYQETNLTWKEDIVSSDRTFVSVPLAEMPIQYQPSSICY